MAMAGDGYSAGWYDYREHEICLKRWPDDSVIEPEIERVPFEWYFYARTDQIERVLQSSQIVALIDDVRQSEGGWSRVYSDPRWDARRELVYELRDRGVEPAEADVSPMNRFLTDHPVKFAQKLRVMFYDLETDARMGWGHIPEHRVLSFAWHGRQGVTKYRRADRADDTGEGDLLERFVRIADRHDLLVAWNGDAYDEVVLRARTRYQGIQYRWARLNFLDQMQLFKMYYARDARAEGVRVSFALDNVARHMLGIGKIKGVTDHGIGGNPADRTVWVFHNRPKLLKRYNKRDVDLQVRIDEKEQHIEAHRVMSNLCNRFLSSYALRTGYLGDAFLLRYGGEIGYRFPTKLHSFDKGSEEWKKRLESKIRGAFVMDPEVGFHHDVQVVDFASLYPSIIRTFNISPEMRVTGELEAGRSVATASNGARFYTDADGIFPAVVRTAVERRAPWKARVKAEEEAGREGGTEWLYAKHISDAYKVLSNTMYGILAAAYLRYYDRECGEAVTDTGRDLIQLSADLARSGGVPVIAGDTDSEFVQCPEDRVPSLVADCAEFIDRWVAQRGGRPGYIRLEHDATYERLVYVTKKRYAGKKKGVEYLDVKGLELMRTDRCRLARELQRRILEYMLTAPRPTPHVAERILARWQDDLYAGRVDIEDLVITQSLSQPIDEYKQITPHVRVARWLLENGHEVYQGMRIRYLISGKRRGTIQAVAADAMPDHYDPQLYWEDQVFPPTYRVLKAAWPEYAWGVHAKRSATQHELFKRPGRD